MQDNTRILTHAKIYTLDPAQPVAGALVIRGGRVIAVGDPETLTAQFGPAARTDDLGGGTVLPGLTDAHVHLKHYALSLQKIGCQTRTLAACLRKVRERAQTTPPGSWILGHGWQQNDWPDCRGGVGGFPTAAMLDAISTVHPIYLTAKSLHAAWANTPALKAAGLNSGSDDPPDGALGRFPDGSLTGILLEGAMSLVSRRVPKVADAELRQALAEAQRHLWAFGLTGVHDFDRRDCFAALQQLDSAGELKLRVVKNIPLEDLEHAAALGLRSGFGSDTLRIGNVKAFADGALGPHTAAMIRPYADDPQNRGMLLLDAEELFESGRQAARNGLAMTVHAIGDAANHEVIEAYERLRRFERENRLPALRHRIEHVQLLCPDDVDRLSALDVIASMQPIHATSDMFSADKYWGARSRTAYAWRTLLDVGTRMAFGSDAPVESPNPFWGLHAAVTRRRRDGSPGPEGWYPEQKLNRTQALEGFTTGAAYAAGLEDRQGKLKAGFYADLIVLERDYFACEADEIAALKPVRTMVDGEWVYGL